MIGRLEQVKGPGYFVDAALRIAQLRQDVRFVLIGEGSLKKELADRVDAAGFKDRIIFAGWRDDIAQMLTMLDIMVLPSLNEAVGLVLIEAQSQGIPVVASNVGGIPETIKENETGILVPAGHADKLAQAILFLLDHPDKRAVNGKSGAGMGGFAFQRAAMAENISRLYEGLLHAKHVILKLRSLRAFFCFALPALRLRRNMCSCPAAIHMSSDISDGKLTLEQIAACRRENGISVLIPTDRDSMSWEYGMPACAQHFEKKGV